MENSKELCISPIQTRYRGYHFRSRLEARWAVFFDALGIKWEYEPEGYNINGRNYLPDFWFPEFGVFVEIKPIPQKDFEFYRDFSYKINRAIILICGTPWDYDAIFFGWEDLWLMEYIETWDDAEREKFNSWENSKEFFDSQESYINEHIKIHGISREEYDRECESIRKEREKKHKEDEIKKMEMEVQNKGNVLFMNCVILNMPSIKLGRFKGFLVINKKDKYYSVFVSKWERNGNVSSSGILSEENVIRVKKGAYLSTEDAILESRSARFEHGDSGAT